MPVTDYSCDLCRKPSPLHTLAHVNRGRWVHAECAIELMGWESIVRSRATLSGVVQIARDAHAMATLVGSLLPPGSRGLGEPGLG